MILTHIDFQSDVLGMSTACDMMLPQEEAPETGFRTLWLLHGLSGDETIWQRNTSLERYAEGAHLAIVMPSVLLSCYSDMVHGQKFYTYLTEELPRLMRDFFPLSSRREDNYICGLSMGGEGALKLGLANPDRYSVIGCLSAAVFSFPWEERPDYRENPLQFLCYEGKKLSGSPEDGYENAKKILAQHKPVPRIYHTIGDQDFLTVSAYETKRFFESLPGNPFDYTFEEAPGEHDWKFWDDRIRRFLLFLDGKL